MTDRPLCCKEAIISVPTETKGRISFGYGCVIHPKARIIIEGDCSVIFGEYNIIEENVTIKAKPKFNSVIGADEMMEVYIGNYNHFKVGCYLENTLVNDYNIFDYNCHLEDTYVDGKKTAIHRSLVNKRYYTNFNSSFRILTEANSEENYIISEDINIYNNYQLVKRTKKYSLPEERKDSKIPNNIKNKEYYFIGRVNCKESKLVEIGKTEYEKLSNIDEKGKVLSKK